MPPIRPELLDKLLKDYQKPEDLLGQDGPERARFMFVGSPMSAFSQLLA